jgi:hypothetical protein
VVPFRLPGKQNEPPSQVGKYSTPICTKTPFPSILFPSLIFPFIREYSADPHGYLR